MQTAIKGQVVYSCILIFFIQLLPFLSKAQLTKESSKLIADQVASPIKMEIRSFIREADRKKLKCNLNFFSIKFIINTASFTCDTVLFSKSVDAELKQAITNIFRKNNVEWSLILKDIKCANRERLELIFPVYLSRDRCTITKLTGLQWWDIFNELVIEGNSEVIILGSMSMSMNH